MKTATCECFKKEYEKLNCETGKINHQYLKVGCASRYDKNVLHAYENQVIFLDHNYCPQCGAKYEDE